MLYWSGWEIMSKLFVAVIVGFLIYLSRLIYRKEVKENIATWKNASWIFVYLAGLCVITKYGSFAGGSGEIKVGIDFAIIAVFSVIVMYLSQKSMLPSEITEKNIDMILKGHGDISGSEMKEKSYSIK